MRHANFLIYDEFIPKGTDGSGTNYVVTGTQHNSQLGRLSSLAIQIVVDNTTGSSGTFKLQVQASCDGRNWLNRGSEITTGTMSSMAPIVAAWADACDGSTFDTGPLLGFVRFKMWFTDAANSSAHVKVYVTQRGHHG
jgi:hypothetical protein